MSDDELTDHLRSRGLEPAVVTPLLGGEKNRSWLVVAATGRHFVGRSYSLATPGEVEYELHATEFLARAGFRTPAPLRAADGSLWSQYDGRPFAVFDFVAGEHPPERADGFWSTDLSRGLDAAALAGELHRLCDGRQFAGERQPARDPLHRIAAFLDGPYARHPALRDAVAQLTAQHKKMAALYADPAGLPRGLVHNDITAHNLLLDGSEGRIAALIDFDDCLTSFLLYDLGPIADVWGRDADRRADLNRIRQLVDAHQAVRPLTGRESGHVLDFIATHAAATGVTVLTNKLRAGAEVGTPRDSHSMAFFLDLRAGGQL